MDRMMGESKLAVKNKAKVEGSISSHFLHHEVTYFCSHYFKNFSLVWSSSIRNDPHSIVDDIEGPLYILRKSGRLSGRSEIYWLNDNE